MADGLSYKESGVDIDLADSMKQEMSEILKSSDKRILNSLGAFASLYDGHFPEIKEPVLVLKTEEPGSKQKLAFQHGRVRSLGFDLVNHLVNDAVVMGATPLAMQDTVICGKLEPQVVNELVKAISDACAEQGCSLVGGETSEQPGVIEPGLYVLAAFLVGVVERSQIIDGRNIEEGDVVLAVASNGIHTNGYTLIRALIDRKPEILEREVNGESFLDAVLRPHRCYYQELRGLFGDSALHGLAHVTGGGIRDNLKRILPKGLSAQVGLGDINVLPIFSLIREIGGVEEEDMLRTFNLGVGLIAVVAASEAERLKAQFSSACYQIGTVVSGDQAVECTGSLQW